MLFFSAEVTCRIFWILRSWNASFLGINRCFRNENVVAGVGIVWAVASWMFADEMCSSPISLAFRFVISEVSCVICSCIFLYRVLFSVVIVSFYDDVVWLLQCNYSLALLRDWSWFLPTKLFLLSICLRLVWHVFLCRFVLLFVLFLLLLSRLMHMTSQLIGFELNVSVGVSSFLTRSLFGSCVGLNFSWWNFFCFCCLSAWSRIFWVVFIVSFISW